jgi:hypothetical protein
MSKNAKNIDDVAKEFDIAVSISEDVSEPNENVIASPKRKSTKKVASKKSVANNAIGSFSAERENVVKNPEPVGRVTVAIHSTKNVNWGGVGTVKKGYNIVSKEQADQWLTRRHIRLATPEEIAQEYGV